MMKRKTLRFSRWANMPPEEFEKLPPSLVAYITYKLIQDEVHTAYYNKSLYIKKKNSTYKIWKNIEHWKSYATEDQLSLYNEILEKYKQGK